MEFMEDLMMSVCGKIRFVRYLLLMALGIVRSARLLILLVFFWSLCQPTVNIRIFAHLTAPSSTQKIKILLALFVLTTAADANLTRPV